MSPNEVNIIFHAQCKNVREITKAWNHMNRNINKAIKDDDNDLVKFQTKMLGLVFCAYSEAIFLKLIHTDNKFSSEEILEIKKERRKSIVSGWKKCIDIALWKINSKKSNHIPKVRKKIDNLIKEYIEEPSLIRNKIAHGQWCIALNRENTKENIELTEKVNNLTVVDLLKYKDAFDSLSTIVEDIIESPNKAHWKFYWKHIVEFEKNQKRMSKFTLEDKREKLQKKYKKYKDR